MTALLTGALVLTACGDRDASAPAAPSPPAGVTESAVPKVNEPADPDPAQAPPSLPASPVDRFTRHVE
ncbi:hypothetical protein ACI3ET_10310 [Ornithinimicrobium sp. LYQ121]